MTTILTNLEPLRAMALGMVAEIDRLAGLAVPPVATTDDPPASFSDALSVILRHEGGYVNHPRDPGGRTNLGVTQRVWEEYIGAKATEADMRALTQAKVEPLYEKLYWRVSGADRLPAGIGLCVFDFAVNSGPSRAVRYLQMVVGATQDGVFGPQTLAETMKDIADRGEADLIHRYQAAREKFYRSLRTFPTFGKGWLRRNSETTAKALEMA